jgi:AraC-like DNA-binding protein
MQIGFSERFLYNSSTVNVGAFRLKPWHPEFEQAGKIQEEYLIVFPRTSVFIQQEGQPIILADPNVAMLYNAHQPYRRKKHSERGDLCDYFAFPQAVVLAAIQDLEPRVRQDTDTPFPRSHTSVAPDLYLLQRKVVEHLMRFPSDPSLFVEEASLHILEMTLQQAFPGGSAGHDCRAHTRRIHAEIAHQARLILNEHYTEPLTIDELAAELFVSPFHLCRIFRQETGLTIHAYLEQIRLRVALEHLLSTNQDLTTTALSLGFSSHSHFSHTMRKAFGLPPSRIRALNFTHLSKILTA